MNRELPRNAKIIQLENGLWQITIPQDNWAGDFYCIRAKTRQKVINRALNELPI